MTSPSRPVDPIDRAHLTGVSAPTPPIHRYDASPRVATIARRYWVPVWDIPDGQVHTQKVLQYPICLIVVSADYGRFYGVTPGASTVDLAGRGWAFGTMLQPAAGRLLWQRPVSQLTDRHVDIDDVPGLAGADLTSVIRTIMTPDPSDPARHAEAIAFTEELLAGHLPIDGTGMLINAIVERVESDQGITRVDQLAEAFALSERQLQRISRDRLGLTPKWLIQRRRLHDATLRLKDGAVSLADIACELGYSDQAHFTRDFSQVTGMPPGAYLADQ
ncbi:helix-turn-helix domain-containing protein [soil metagenome]